MTEKDLGQIIPDILATATVDNKVGEPAVNVTVEQINEVNRLERKFNFEFVNMKGEKGDTPVKGVDYLTEEEKQQFTTETLSLVTAEGAKQVKATTDEGAKQIKTVTDKGAEQIALVSTEGTKVIEQVKKLVGVNPTGGDAVSVGGLTRPEIEKGINDNLINAVNIAKNGIFDYKVLSKESYLAFTTSTFSGWKTKVTIETAEKIIGAKIKIKARETPITQVRLTVSLNNVLINDYIEDVLIGANSEKELDIYFLKELDLKNGDILEVGFQCNQLCSIYTVRDVIPIYFNEITNYYTTNGSLGDGWSPSGDNSFSIFTSFLYNNKKEIENNKKEIGALNTIPVIVNEKNIFSLCDTKKPERTTSINEAIKGIGFYINKSDLFNNGNVISIRLNQFNIKSTGKEEEIIVEILDVNKTVLKQYKNKFLPNNTDDYIIKVFFDKDDFTSFPNDLILGIRTDTPVAPSYDNTFKYKSKNKEIHETIVSVYKYSCYYSSAWFATTVGASAFLCPNVEFYYSLNIKTDTTLTDKNLPANSFKVGEEIERIDNNINRIENIINSGSESSLLKLPERFDLVVGDTFELFYKGIINVSNTDIYDVTVDCSKNIGQAYKRKYVYTPKTSEVGKTTMTFNLIDNLGNKLESQEVVFNIINVPTNPSEIKNILCIGDSLTTGGEWANEFRKRLIGTSSHIPFNITNVNFLGTKEREGTKYEGYGGWTFNSYLTANKSTEFMYVHGTFDKTVEDQHSVYKDTNGTQWKLETITPTKIKIIRIGYGMLPATGTLTWVSGGQNHSNIIYTSSEMAEGNPFWDTETQAVNFMKYVQKFKVSKIDYVYILLGWNNTGTNTETYTNQCKQLLDLILKDFPDCKVGLLGLQVPSQNGFGENYGIAWKYYDKLQHIWKLQEIYQTISKEPQYTGKVDYINISAQFDSEYNMPHAERNANIRTTQKEYVQTNGVHPAIDGYMQIADAVTRNFLTKI